MPSSCTYAKQSKIKLLKERQSRWLDQRKAVTDAVEVTREIEQNDTAFFRHHDVQNNQPHDSSCTNNSIALQQITERISNRIRDEIQKEFYLSAPALKNQKETMISNLEIHLEEYLSSELHTHVCQICFELMKPPDKSPMMIFPCGHTFCKECIHKHQSKGVATAKMCPYCREQIKSVAENQPLKQLIDRFASQSGRLKNADATTLDEVFSRENSCSMGNTFGCKEGEGKDDGSREINKYKAEHVSCSIRQRILANELEEMAELVKSLSSRKEGLQLALDMMVTEKGSVQRNMDCLCEQLKLIEVHMKEQVEKIAAIDGEINHHKDQMKVVQLTIKNLEGDIAKITALGKAAGACDKDFCSDIGTNAADETRL